METLLALAGLKPWIIVLIVIGSILLVFVAYVIFVLICFAHFSKKISKHEQGFKVLAITKLNNIKKLFAILEKNDIHLDPEAKIFLDAIDVLSFEQPGSLYYNKSMTNLTYIKTEILYAFRKYKSLNNNLEFNIALQNVEDMELNYRNEVAACNSDIQGYNFWLNMPPTKWILKGFGIKKKDLI